MDTTKAKRELGWQPEHTGLDALRSTLRRGPDEHDKPDEPAPARGHELDDLRARPEVDVT